ncbi:MAG TPA: trehalase-like domain-containing protein, partial [Candidatus Thermoplasmatota archaeon]|nr:trehalase-like domain-containing protein [Candidatus Thermoplasmatota archaeon]
MTAPLVVAAARYPEIADHGVIGDGRSAALVCLDGTVDWWCPPRFDAPSVFGCLLDARRGGHLRVAPAGPSRPSMRYVPDTNVLETTHETPTGTLRVHDMLAPPSITGVDEAVLLRRVACVAGEVEVDVEVAPRFRYGETLPRFSDAPHGLLARGGGEILLVRGVALARRGPGVRGARVLLREGESFDLRVRHASVDVPVPFAKALAAEPAEIQARIEARDRAFAARTKADGPHAHLVRRAALALRLLQHEETGAIVAAPTTSL